MSETKTHIWDALCKTDPAHTKKFNRSGGFSGTAIKPVWTILRMTEVFGTCGTGWGMDKPEFVTQSANDELLVFCTVSVWYVDNGVTGRVYGVGGDKYLVSQKAGLRASDEAYKMAYTDAVGNALKYIGVAADVHMGLFDDSKYVSKMAEEFDPKPAAPKSAPGVAYITAKQADELRNTAKAKGMVNEMKAALNGAGITSAALIPLSDFLYWHSFVDTFEVAR